MDMHTGSTDEYESDDHHFEGDGDSSEDELVVAKKQRVGVSSGTKKKRVVVAASAETKTNNDKNDNSDEDIIDSDDDDFLAPQNKKRSKKPYHSDDDDDSEEEETKSKNTNNKQGRRAALGKMNDNKASTKKSSDSSDSDDDSDSDDLGLGFGSNKQRKAASDRKRAALMQMYPSSSDDDSDESSSGDISFGAKKRRKNNNSNKKPPAKAAASSSRSKAIALDDSSSDSHDSDSSECVDVTMSASTRSKTKSSAPAPAAAARASATTAAIDCMSSDSDSDIEIPPTTGGRSLRFTRANPRPLEQTTTTTYKTDKGAAIHHHDPSVRANSNATLEEAKRVRAALLQSQRYHAEDVNLPSLPSQVVPKKASPPAVLDLSSNNGDYESTTRVSSSTTRAVVNTTTTPAVSYNGPIITIYLRYRDDSSNKESKVSLKIKMDQPLQHLVDQFQQHHYGKITQMKFDGQNLNLTKTPSFYDMDDEDLVDVVVIANSHGIPFAAAAAATTTAAATTAAVSSAPVLPPRREEKVIHVRGGAAAGTRNETYEIKKSDPLTKVVNAYCKQNQLSTVTLEYNGRKLDTTKSCAQLDIPNNAYLDAIVASGPSINLIFRVNGKSNETERISIRMKEAFQPAMETFAQRRNVGLSQCQFVFDGETLRPSTTPEHLDLEGDEIIDVKVTESAPAPPIRATTTQSTARAAASASTTASAAPVMITIETNRNQNNNSRQKKWKLHDTSLVTKLKTDYTKYYKSKGCKQVQFYFRNQLITNESQSLRDLGIRNGDMVYAMENGKAYK